MDCLVWCGVFFNHLNMELCHTGSVSWFWSCHIIYVTYRPSHDKTNKMTVSSEDSDQPGHPPSLIRVFAVCMKIVWFLSYPLSAQRRLWSDWADAQARLIWVFAGRTVILLVLSWSGSYVINVVYIKLDQGCSRQFHWVGDRIEYFRIWA